MANGQQAKIKDARVERMVEFNYSKYDAHA